MTVSLRDRFKAANAFWIGLSKIGLTPAAVLSQARVPVTVNNGDVLRPRLPRRSRAPCSLQATVYARGTANQNQQRRMLNRARVATRAGGNAAPLDGRRLCVIR